MKKLICLIVSLILMSSSVVFAADQYAYSIGTNYDSGIFDSDIDTSQDAIDAATDFGIAGYISYYNIKPIYQYLRGDNPNTNDPRMESEILFFSGHGNYQCVSFNYKKKGDYKTGIYYGKDYDNSSTGYKYAGIKSYHMSKVDLATFAACKTADGSDNITKRVVSEGADTAVGWKKSVGATSHTKWLGRYTNELARGKIVQEAVDYANSFSYTDNNVKSVIIEGNKNLKIKLSDISFSKINVQNDSVGKDEVYLKNINKKEINKIKHKTYNVKQNLEFNVKKANCNSIIDYIKDEIDSEFDIDDYNIYLTNTNKNRAVIDFIYKIGGFETNNSYTVLIKNSKAKKIFHNTIENEVKSEIKNNIMNIKTNNLNAKAVEQKIEDNDYTIEEQESKYYYDLQTNKVYMIILTTLKHKPTKTFVKSEYFYEIK
ncbi:hypothetical protein [Paramaledivibacter caminithermalis]|uniref:Uncharacterized protein n=1 Tax=Paramaledivibacter caminithermalis (strain DSM 15212 / CIP 107654 / DViRD3) TaxID=1121301 RepID=A0A1M6TVJ5_PARC5|nr:hypothetical protein [Paramaledivibacter caminithermalis]SHK60910.1 hypothetical protein SAMN02745912_03805 [Paramaledivibacter caminithermalis DSM 15212]